MCINFFSHFFHIRVIILRAECICNLVFSTSTTAINSTQGAVFHNLHTGSIVSGYNVFQNNQIISNHNGSHIAKTQSNYTKYNIKQQPVSTQQSHFSYTHKHRTVVMCSSSRHSVN